MIYKGESMDIENKIFKRTEVLYNKLIPFGFKKINDKYIISKNILNDSFRIDVEIENGNIKGKVYDLSFGEEYTNYRMENQTGEFVNTIKEEFEKFLLDIKNKCTSPKYFITDQANRITNLVENKYNNIPEFPWKKSPGFGIFRNPENKKWYGLIFNINRNKLDDGDGEVEAINLKLDKEKIVNLLNQKGFYPAYHMNKKHWITIILDDTISDKDVMNYIDESHTLTKK